MRRLVLLCFVACRSEPAAEPPRPEAPALLAQVPETVVGVVDDWSATKATLRRFRRDGARWQPVGAAWPAVVGKAGTAWGSGLHGEGVPAGREGPVKREGDGKSPAGVFALGKSYGYAAAAPSKLGYQALDAAWKCVDDGASTQYNRILDQQTVAVDWKSAEDMRRSDELYTWVVDVAHNARRVPGSGSCIFLHVWGGPDSATLGCTAMPAPVLGELIATLDPQAVFVLLPRAEYAELARRWDLPPL